MADPTGVVSVLVALEFVVMSLAVLLVVSPEAALPLLLVFLVALHGYLS